MPGADFSLGAQRPGAPPLVAVATPVYNGGKYLAETMASVQAQTYPNLVHVLVDNASTDETPAIIERFATGRVRVISSRNPETIPMGRNWCAAAAAVPPEAKYFAILCADDTLAPQAIARMVGVAESDPGVELVGCVARRGAQLTPSSLPRSQSVFEGKEIARQFLDKEADDIPHMYGLFRRRAQDLEGGFFDCSLMMLDTDACLRALARGKFGYVHEPLVNVRMHPEQLTAKLLETRNTVFEPLRLIERWAKVVMGPREAARCRARHLRVIFRFMLYWRARGQQHLVERGSQWLSQHNASPSLSDYPRAVAEWPLLQLGKLARRRRALAATEALGYGPARFPVDGALPRILDVGSSER